MSNLSSGALENLSELVTFLIPITRKYLILPNVSIAEIIHDHLPKQVEDTPAWYLGMLEWRGLDVPLISFEVLNEEPFQAGLERQNIAILNGVSNVEVLPFFAVLTQAPPRLLRITADEIHEHGASENGGPAESMVVTASGEVATIPNLDYIEAALVEL